MGVGQDNRRDESRIGQLRGAVVLSFLFALPALGACAPKAVESSTNAPVASKAPVSIEAKAAGQSDKTASSATSDAGHGYVSREGNVFYYRTGDGSLLGALDLGTLPKDQDVQGMMSAGDRAVQFDGRVFAAVSPGSSVVRVMEMRPGEQIFRPVANYALNGEEVAAVALRDSLAGRLLYPSPQQLADAKRETEAAEADELAAGSARPDDYAESEDSSQN